LTLRPSTCALDRRSILRAVCAPENGQTRAGWKGTAPRSGLTRCRCWAARTTAVIRVTITCEVNTRRRGRPPQLRRREALQQHRGRPLSRHVLHLGSMMRWMTFPSVTRLVTALFAWLRSHAHVEILAASA